MTHVSLESLKEFTSTLEENNLKYIVIAGIGLDGKRGYLTRPHQDLDIFCLKSDLKKLEKILKKLKYSGEKYHDLYKVFRKDGSKIDLALVTIEGNYAVTYGRNAITKFPKKLFNSPQKGNIENVKFNIGPNEILKTWGVCSHKGNDSEYANTLKVDEKIMKKITRVARKGGKYDVRS